MFGWQTAKSTLTFYFEPQIETMAAPILPPGANVARLTPLQQAKEITSLGSMDAPKPGTFMWLLKDNCDGNDEESPKVKHRPAHVDASLALLPSPLRY